MFWCQIQERTIVTDAQNKVVCVHGKTRFKETLDHIKLAHDLRFC